VHRLGSPRDSQGSPRVLQAVVAELADALDSKSGAILDSDFAAFRW
jgi:hypothetical protein